MHSLRFYYRTILELATVWMHIHLLGLVRFVLSLDLSPVCQPVHFFALPHPRLRRILLLHLRLQYISLCLCLLVYLSRSFLAVPSKCPNSQASKEEEQPYSNSHTYADCFLLRIYSLVYTVI
jgi:hypothetical protein